LEVYDIANNQITGASSLGSVGLDWQLGGFAADAPGASPAAMGGASQVGQLVQAMASLGPSSGVADDLNVASLAQAAHSKRCSCRRTRSHDYASLTRDRRSDAAPRNPFAAERSARRGYSRPQ
jgi:hypothetical protein